MSAIALVLGVVLAWPGFTMLAASFNGDLRSKHLPVAVLLSFLAIGLFVYGTVDLVGKGGGDFERCGAGPTAWDC